MKLDGFGKLRNSRFYYFARNLILSAISIKAYFVYVDTIPYKLWNSDKGHILDYHTVSVNTEADSGQNVCFLQVIN